VTPTQRDLLTAAYDGTLAYLDAQLATLFEELEKRDQLAHTVVVIVGDHGEALGEHGFYGHGSSVYQDQVRVPLIVRFEGKVPKGLRITTPVTTADVAMTILYLSDAAGEGSALAGQSLARFWARSQPNLTREPRAIVSEVGYHEGTPDSWPVHHGWAASLTSGPWHFLQQQNGRVELYRWTDDRLETNNLAETTEGRPIAERFERELASARRTSSPRDRMTRIPKARSLTICALFTPAARLT